MPEFKYKAVDQRGKVRKGKMAGSSKAFVKNRLRNLRLRPLSIRAINLERGEGGDSFFSRFYYFDEKGTLQMSLTPETMTDKDLIVFTKQFATMLASGVPLVQALGVLAQQQRIRYFGRILQRIQTAVENGAALSESMEPFRSVFDELYVSMVRAGEASGNLDTILLKLVGYIEKSAKVRAQVRSAMAYPALIIVVAIAVVAGLLVFVVPQFASQYSSSGQQLPELTQLVVDSSEFLSQYWYFLLGGVFAVLIGIRLAINTVGGKQAFDKIILRLPGFGVLMRKIAVGRFCATMATMLSSGVNLLEGLTICASSAGNKVIEAFILEVRTAVEQGEKLSDPLSKSDLFPPMVTSMVAVGETTGALDDMLGKVSEFYEEEVDLAVSTLLSLVEPLLIIVVGGIVGFIIVALYLPVFDLASISAG